MRIKENCNLLKNHKWRERGGVCRISQNPTFSSSYTNLFPQTQNEGGGGGQHFMIFFRIFQKALKPKSTKLIQTKAKKYQKLKGVGLSEKKCFFTGSDKL